MMSLETSSTYSFPDIVGPKVVHLDGCGTTGLLFPLKLPQYHDPSQASHPQAPCLSEKYRCLGLNVEICGGGRGRTGCLNITLKCGVAEM